jgi:hypothetical protein
VAIIYLAPALLQGSSCLPSGVASSRRHRTSRPRPPVYVAFQHARFTRAAGYPTPPWALTPRFHPHPLDGQLFSVALSVNAFAPPGSSPVHCPKLSGLSSRRCRRAMTRLVATVKVQKKQGISSRSTRGQPPSAFRQPAFDIGQVRLDKLPPRLK